MRITGTSIPGWDAREEAMSILERQAKALRDTDWQDEPDLDEGES